MRFEYELYDLKDGIKWIFADGLFLVSPKYETEFLLKENALV